MSDDSGLAKVEAGPNLQRQLDLIEARVGRTNKRERWRAFTSAELALLISGMEHIAFGCDLPEDELRDDIEAEIARRKS